MQTLEEKRELLWKAVNGEVELEWLDPNDKGDEWCSLDLNAVGKNVFFAGGTDFEIDDFIFRIVEPRITADDLAEAIEDLLFVAFDAMGWNWLDDDPPEPEATVYPEVIERYKLLLKRYREQESKTTNEVSEAGE